jgi:hypothetical protein
MIERAFVSGQIARSIFEEENRLFIINAGDTESILECTPYEKNLFFGSGAEIKVFENIEIDDLRQKLLKEKSCFDSLYGAIAGFDDMLSEETRILSMRNTEFNLDDQKNSEFVRFRLFGCPVPETAILDKAIELSEVNGFLLLNAIYRDLSDSREYLEFFHKLFKEAIFEFSLQKKHVQIKNRFISQGFFYYLISSFERQKWPHTFSTAQLLENAIEKHAKTNLPIDKQIIAWIEAKHIGKLMTKLKASFSKDMMDYVLNPACWIRSPESPYSQSVDTRHVLTKKINEVSEDLKAIFTMVNTIVDIVDQANLLALNTAIEAARSGQHYQDLFVVASGVRNLIERIKPMCIEVSEKIRIFQPKVNEIIQALAPPIVETSDSTHLVKMMEENFTLLDTLIHVLRETGEKVSGIPMNLKEQSNVSRVFFVDKKRIKSVLTGIESISVDAKEEILHLSDTFEVLKHSFWHSNL